MFINMNFKCNRKIKLNKDRYKFFKLYLFLTIQKEYYEKVYTFQYVEMFNVDCSLLKYSFLN